MRVTFVPADDLFGVTGTVVLQGEGGEHRARTTRKAAEAIAAAAATELIIA